MKKEEIKKILMEMRTAENESQVNNMLGKIDLIPEEKLELMIIQIGDDEESIKKYLKGRLDEKQNDEKFPINQMFEYGISETCVHLHMPVDLHSLIAKIGIKRTVDTVNLQLLDAIEKIKQLKNDVYYRVRDIDSIYMISPILIGREMKFLNGLDFETQIYTKKDLQNEEFVNENQEAKLATNIFGNKQNVGVAKIDFETINSEKWNEKIEGILNKLKETAIEFGEK